MPTAEIKTLRVPFPLAAAVWREFLFWVLLLPAFAALSSTAPRRQIAGLFEFCGFLIVAISSLGRLKTLGLEFIAWEPINRKAISICVACGLTAGAAILVVARLSAQPLGLERGWNKAVLAIVLGPILEEVVFRGYLLTLGLYLTKRFPGLAASFLAVACIAILFALAHLGRPGITLLQVSCIAITGGLYGGVRLRYHSTAAAVLTHSAYNLALYLRFWSGI